jgi:hypothetical protein
MWESMNLIGVIVSGRDCSRAENDCNKDVGFNPCGGSRSLQAPEIRRIKSIWPLGPGLLHVKNSAAKAVYLEGAHSEA